MKITADHRAEVANKRGKLNHSDNGTNQLYKLLILHLQNFSLDKLILEVLLIDAEGPLCYAL